MNENYRIQAEDLKKFAEVILQKVGVRQKHAKETADILVDANLRGIDTHGVYLSNLYARRLEKNLINPLQNFILKKTGGCGHIGCRFFPGAAGYTGSSSTCCAACKRCRRGHCSR